jgi:hypothetical protein
MELPCSIHPHWRRAVSRSALLLALVACSSDDSGPSDQVLVGTWGSEAAAFVAIQAGAEVRTGCGASCMAPTR